MQKKTYEKEQGRKIQFCAGKVWGWATPAGTLRVKRRVDEFLPYLESVKGKGILEIGCGTGIFTRLFRQKGMSSVAVDISYDLLRKAKQDNPGVHFIQADAENMPFKEKAFDCILGVSVLHHLDSDAAFKNIKRVLKDGGMVLFSEPNMANPQIFIQKRIRWVKKLLHDTPSETAFLRWPLKSLLIKNGFTKVRVYPFEFLHPWTPRLLIKAIKLLEMILERTPFVREISGSLLIYAKK